MKLDQLAMVAGTNSSCLPAWVPAIPFPVAWTHQLWVWRSYMIRLLKIRLPLTPKSRTSPSNVRGKAIAVLQSGQNVTVIGCPASSSLTISCQVRIESG